MPEDPGSGEPAAGGQVLVVSRNAAWRDAVQGAAAHLGWSAVIASGPRDALTRLAVADPHYSHLLVDSAAAGDLFDELADLAQEVVHPETDMLVLGQRDRRHKRLRTISQATAGDVVRALTTESAPDDTAAINLADLREALNGARIDTRYQPIVRLADRRPMGLEALARLNHPVRGILAPDRFIPVVEDAGLASRLTDLVCMRALSDLSRPDISQHQLSLSLNFPLDVLLRPDSLARLDAMRTAAGVPADRIVIELTESRPVQDISAVDQALRRLRALGYRIAIDDAGPDMPSLDPLLALPFTSVKLDKDIVQQALTDPSAQAFLAATIRTAKAHGKTVVAEGVEAAEIWTAMHDLGADEAQGFLVARPLPLAAVPVWIEHWTSSSAL